MGREARRGRMPQAEGAHQDGRYRMTAPRYPNSHGPSAGFRQIQTVLGFFQPSLVVGGAISLTCHRRQGTQPRYEVPSSPGPIRRLTIITSPPLRFLLLLCLLQLRYLPVPSPQEADNKYDAARVAIQVALPHTLFYPRSLAWSLILFHGFHEDAKMRSFRLSGLLALSAALTVQAAALQVDNDADVALILARQAPGTPQYECHSNCGKMVLSQTPFQPQVPFP